MKRTSGVSIAFGGTLSATGLSDHSSSPRSTRSITSHVFSIVRACVHVCSRSCVNANPPKYQIMRIVSAALARVFESHGGKPPGGDAGSAGGAAGGLAANPPIHAE